MNAYKGVTCGIQIDGVHRTGLGAVAAMDTQAFLDPHPTALTLGIGSGAGSHARQTLASNPVDNPPAEAMRIPAVSQDRSLWTTLEQASEQE
jgi:hypothetical protein